MAKTIFVLISAFLFFASLPAEVMAGLYIDNTSTTDKGHFSVEYTLDYYKDVDKQYDPEEDTYTKKICKETDITSEISYGLTQNWDVTFTTPYEYVDDSSTGKANGFSDFYLNTKYRLWDENKTLPSFALSFDFKADNASEPRCLGTGMRDYSLTGIFSKDIKEYTFDLNLGYTWIGGKTDNILYYIFDVSRDLTDRLSICTEIYGDTIFKGNFDANQFYWALSFSYDINKMVSFESGVGIGISKASPDYQFSSSVTFDF